MITMQITVKTLAAKVYQFEVTNTTTVGHLKAMIQESTGAPPETQILSFKGKQFGKQSCDEGVTMEQMEVADGAEIYLTPQGAHGINNY